jgi:hypothetical protein
MCVLNDAGVDVLVLPAHCSHVLQPFDVAVPSPLKTAMARYDDDADIVLTADQNHELHVSRDDPHWLREKRQRLINTFLNAWSLAACRANVLSGFRATGLCSIDVEEPLSAPATRRMVPGEIYAPPDGDPNEMNCALVTGKDKLALLAAKPNKVFPEFPEKIVDQHRQWIELLGKPTVSGRFLAAPSVFIWGHQVENRIQLTEASDRQSFAYVMPKPTPADVCAVLQKVAPGIPNLIVCLDYKLAQSFARHLTQLRVHYALVMGRQKQEDRLANWHAFQSGEIDVCVTTWIAMRGLVSARRTLAIYPETPNAAIVRQTSEVHTLMFVRKGEQLDDFDLQGLVPDTIIIPSIQEDTLPIF